MFTVKIDDLDLAQIARSGQCFRMREKKEGPGIFEIAALEDYVEAAHVGEGFIFSCKESEFNDRWRQYFDLDTDYGRIKKSVAPEDAYLTEAVLAGWGVRILNQDLWEMLVTFLISQNNNIGRITKSVAGLCEKFGEKRQAKGLVKGPDGTFAEEERVYFTFPRPETIAQAGLLGLSDLGLGYRDKYICELACRLEGPEGRQWLERLREADYDTAHALLMEQYGVGKKVADCVCLFGLHHIGAFPMDTHVKQIIAAHYPKGFPMERYEGYAGVLQQYMFYYKVNKLEKPSGPLQQTAAHEF